MPYNTSAITTKYVHASTNYARSGLTVMYFKTFDMRTFPLPQSLSLVNMKMLEIQTDV
jgi:hypothetical protein